MAFAENDFTPKKGNLNSPATPSIPTSYHTVDLPTPLLYPASFDTQPSAPTQSTTPSFMLSHKPMSDVQASPISSSFS
jgi:hypothetical protein